MEKKCQSYGVGFSIASNATIFQYFDRDQWNKQCFKDDLIERKV